MAYGIWQQHIRGSYEVALAPLHNASAVRGLYLRVVEDCQTLIHAPGLCWGNDFRVQLYILLFVTHDKNRDRLRICSWGGQGPDYFIYK